MMKWGYKPLTDDRITSDVYSASVGKVYKTELLSKYRWLILLVMQIQIKQNIQTSHIFQITHTEYE